MIYMCYVHAQLLNINFVNSGYVGVIPLPTFL